MKNEKVTSPTGAFAIEGKVLVPIMEKAPATGEAAAGSVRAYIASLGYEDGQLHTVITFTSNKVACICFRKWSKVPALVIVKSEGAISYAEVESEIAAIDWGFEWEQLKFTESLPSN